MGTGGVSIDNRTLTGCGNSSFSINIGNLDYVLTVYANDTVGHLTTARVTFSSVTPLASGGSAGGATGTTLFTASKLDCKTGQQLFTIPGKGVQCVPCEAAGRVVLEGDQVFCILPGEEKINVTDQVRGVSDFNRLIVVGVIALAGFAIFVVYTIWLLANAEKIADIMFSSSTTVTVSMLLYLLVNPAYIIIILGLVLTHKDRIFRAFAAGVSLTLALDIVNLPRIPRVIPISEVTGLVTNIWSFVGSSVCIVQRPPVILFPFSSSTVPVTEAVKPRKVPRCITALTVKLCAPAALILALSSPSKLVPVKVTFKF